MLLARARSSSEMSEKVDKKDELSVGGYRVPASDRAIERRSDSLVMRGLQDLEAAEQEIRNLQDIFGRLDKINLSYGRGTADTDQLGIWKAGDTFTVFTGDSEPDGDDLGGPYVLDSFLVGSDELDFWKDMGDPQELTQEKLGSALRKYRARLLDGLWPGRIREVTPPSESRLMVGMDLFKNNHISLALAIWSEPDGARVEIDGSFVGNTSLTTEIEPGEHSVVLTRLGYDTWSRKLKVRVPEHWSR